MKNSASEPGLSEGLPLNSKKWVARQCKGDGFQADGLKSHHVKPTLYSALFPESGLMS